MSIPHYKYAIIDAQYILHRNTCMLYGRAYQVRPEEIAKTFTYSLLKLVRESFTAEKIILCWDIRNDDGLYNKNQYIDGYKGDRVSPVEAYEAASVSIKIKTADGTITDTDIANFKKVENDYTLYCKRERAKQFIVNNFHLLGINSLAVSGVEADDMAVIASDIIQKELKPTEKSVLVTVDSDWRCLANPYTDFFKTNTKQFFDYEQIMQTEPCDRIDLYKIKFLEEIFSHSHNNVINPLKGIKTYQEVIDLYAEGEMNLINHIPDEYKQYTRNVLKGLDVRRYCTYLYPIVRNALVGGTLDYRITSDFCAGKCKFVGNFNGFSIGINSYKLDDMLDQFNPKLFTEVKGLVEPTTAPTGLQSSTFEEFFGV